MDKIIRQKSSEGNWRNEWSKPDREKVECIFKARKSNVEEKIKNIKKCLNNHKAELGNIYFFKIFSEKFRKHEKDVQKAIGDFTAAFSATAKDHLDARDTTNLEHVSSKLKDHYEDLSQEFKSFNEIVDKWSSLMQLAENTKGTVDQAEEFYKLHEKNILGSSESEHYKKFSTHLHTLRYNTRIVMRSLYKGGKAGNIQKLYKGSELDVKLDFGGGSEVDFKRLSEAIKNVNHFSEKFKQSFENFKIYIENPLEIKNLEKTITDNHKKHLDDFQSNTQKISEDEIIVIKSSQYYKSLDEFPDKFQDQASKVQQHLEKDKEDLKVLREQLEIITASEQNLTKISKELDEYLDERSQLKSKLEATKQTYDLAQKTSETYKDQIEEIKRFKIVKDFNGDLTKVQQEIAKAELALTDSTTLTQDLSDMSGCLTTFESKIATWNESIKEYVEERLKLKEEIEFLHKEFKEGVKFWNEHHNSKKIVGKMVKREYLKATREYIHELKNVKIKQEMTVDEMHKERQQMKDKKNEFNGKVEELKKILDFMPSLETEIKNLKISYDNAVEHFNNYEDMKIKQSIFNDEYMDNVMNIANEIDTFIESVNKGEGEIEYSDLLDKHNKVEEMKKDLDQKLEEAKKFDQCLEEQSKLEGAIKSLENISALARRCLSTYQGAKIIQSKFENNHMNSIDKIIIDAKSLEKWEIIIDKENKKFEEIQKTYDDHKQEFIDEVQKLKKTSLELMVKFKEINPFLSSQVKEKFENLQEVHKKAAEVWNNKCFARVNKIIGETKSNFSRKYEYDLFIEPQWKPYDKAAYEVHKKLEEGLLEKNSSMFQDTYNRIQEAKFMDDNSKKLPEMIQRIEQSLDVYEQLDHQSTEEEAHSTDQWNIPPQETHPTDQWNISASKSNKGRAAIRSREISEELTERGFKKIRWARTQSKLWEQAWTKATSDITEYSDIMQLTKALWFKGKFGEEEQKITEQMVNPSSEDKSQKILGIFSIGEEEQEIIEQMVNLSPEDKSQKILGIFSKCLETLDILLTDSNPYRNVPHKYFSEHYGLNEAQASIFGASNHPNNQVDFFGKKDLDKDKGHFFSIKERNAIINWYDDNYMQFYTTNEHESNYQSAYSKIHAQGLNSTDYEQAYNQQLKESSEEEPEQIVGQIVTQLNSNAREGIWRGVASQSPISATKEISGITKEKLLNMLNKLLDGISEKDYKQLFELRDKLNNISSESISNENIPDYIREYIPKETELLKPETIANALWNTGDLTQRQKQLIKDKGLSITILEKAMEIYSQCLDMFKNHPKLRNEYRLSDKEQKALIEGIKKGVMEYMIEFIKSTKNHNAKYNNDNS